MKILVATNDIVLERMLTVTLTINGFSVVLTKSFREAISIIENGKIKMFLLDQEFEKHNQNAFLDTVRGQKMDVPLLLIGDSKEGWAHICKPVEFPRLKVEMNELFKKRRSLPEKFIQLDELKIDVAKKIVTVKDKIVNLGMMEMAILISLARKAGQVVARETLRTDLEAQGYFFNIAIQHHIWNLKNKLKTVAGDKFKIKLLVGEGFKLSK